MELSTRGIDFSPDYHFPLWYSAVEEFLPEMGLGSRLRLVLVEQGSGLLKVGERRLGFIAPVLICLDEIESPHLEQRASLRARGLYFHPSIINSAFDFTNIRLSRDDSLVSWQDISSLRGFITRNEDFGGVLSLGPVTASRAIQLFDAVRHQLLDQPDMYWICRSRSFLLELLSLSERLLLMPQHCDPSGLVETEAAPADDSIENAYYQIPKCQETVDRVILYLHAHYQEKITIPELTRLFNTNRTTLTAQFHRETGMSVMTYLTL